MNTVSKRKILVVQIDCLIKHKGISRRERICNNILTEEWKQKKPYLKEQRNKNKMVWLCINNRRSTMSNALLREKT